MEGDRWSKSYKNSGSGRLTFTPDVNGLLCEGEDWEEIPVLFIETPTGFSRASRCRKVEGAGGGWLPSTAREPPWIRWGSLDPRHLQEAKRGSPFCGSAFATQQVSMISTHEIEERVKENKVGLDVLEMSNVVVTNNPVGGP